MRKGLLFLLSILFCLSGKMIAQPEAPVVNYSEIPQHYQLYPRNPDDSNRRTVEISGRLFTFGYDTVVVIARRNGEFWKRSRKKLSYNSDSTAAFSLTRKIKADTIDYSFEVLFRASTGELVSDTLIDKVACGDVYIIQGQSNAEAEDRGGFVPYQSHWVRSFGTASDDTSEVKSDTTWSLAQAQFSEEHAYAGIWGLRLGKLIAENHRMPVCILNGAVGGTKTQLHLRNDSLPTDLNTIYGRMLWRAQKAKVDFGIRAILWWQGESNTSNTSRAIEYLEQFPILRDQWKDDYEDGDGSAVHYFYTAQLHTGYGSKANILREYQRILAKEDSETEITAAHDIGGFIDSDHFSPAGYDQFAGRIFRQISRTIYKNDEDDEDIDSPNISQIFFTSGLRNELLLEFSDVETLYWENDSIIDGIQYHLKDYFYFYNDGVPVTTAAVDTGYVNNNILTLKLDSTITANSVSYLPARFYNNTEIKYEGPWLKSAKGVPALSFWQFPITIGEGVPDVTDIPNQTVGVGSSFSSINLDDFVEDPDNLDSELTWTFSGNIELTVTIDADRVATITSPNTNWSGQETVIFTATDPQDQFDSDGATFTINSPPVISDIPNQTISEGSSFSAINLDDFVNDSNHSDAEISWSITGNTNLSATIDENRIVTITPNNPDWNGSEALTFTATDPFGAFDTEVASFTVTGVNDPPVVSGVEDQTVPEGQEFATIALDNFVSDPDNADNELTWSVSGNSDLTVEISASRIATITPPSGDWNGSETITFTATDPGNLSGSDAATFTITAVNNAPAVSNIPDQSIDEGQEFVAINLDDFVSDPDDSDSDITWSVSGNVELIVTISPNRIATITPPVAFWNGSEIITFIATDPSGLSDSDPAIFSISGSNDVPVVSGIPGQTIPEGENFATIPLDDFVEDVDNHDSTLTWLIINNNDLDVMIDENRIASIMVPEAEWNGSETITFIATDPGGLSGSASASFTVTGINDPPIVNDIADQTVEEAGSFAMIPLDDFVEDADNADFQMSWTISGNTDLTFTMDGVRNLTINIPSEEWNGSETLIFTASDPGGLMGSDTATFTVTAINDTPAIANIPNQTVDEGNSFSAIPLDNFIEDIDSDDSEIEWSFTGNTWLNVAIDSNRVVTIFPPNNDWHGSEAINFTAVDPGGLEVNDAATFTVRSINDPPVIADSLPLLSFDEDDSLFFSTSQWLEFVEDVEIPDSLLSIFISGGNNISFFQNGENFTFTAPPNWFGSETFLLSVSDGELGNSAEFTISVQPVNDPPIVMGLPDSLVIFGDSSVVMNMREHAEDIDTPDSLLTWSFQKNGNLLLLDYDPQTTLLTLTGRNIPTAINLTCTVADEFGESSSKTTIVNVKLLTAIDEADNGAIPRDYVMYQNFPNPFNPSTNIKFGLPKSGKVTLEIFNILGQKVATMWNGFKPAGFHSLEFDAQDIPSGVYLYRIQAAAFSQVRKMMLIK